MAKNKKIVLLTLILILLAIAIVCGWYLLQNKIKAKIECWALNPLSCKGDIDCVCADASTTEYPGCFVGNKDYYEKCSNKTGSCYDFCTGWGQPPVKCLDNVCTNSYCFKISSMAGIEPCVGKTINAIGQLKCEDPSWSFSKGGLPFLKFTDETILPFLEEINPKYCQYLNEQQVRLSGKLYACNTERVDQCAGIGINTIQIMPILSCPKGEQARWCMKGACCCPIGAKCD